MSDADDAGERKLVDARGEYRPVARDGEATPDTRWHTCRLLLTTERLLVGTDDGNRAIPHDDLAVLRGEAVPGEVTVGDAVPVRVGDRVLLVRSDEVTDFAPAFHRAIVSGRILPVRHPAAVGGETAGDGRWRKARIHARREELRLSFADGDGARIDYADVESVETTRETVAGEERAVVAIEHSSDDEAADGDVVATQVAGDDGAVDAFTALFGGVGGSGSEADDASVASIDDAALEYDLSDDERQILVALYSGVSPFEVGEFVGLEVDAVEDAYRSLVDAGVLDAVRTRTEVALTAAGRNLASDAMSEE